MADIHNETRILAEYDIACCRFESARSQLCINPISEQYYVEYANALYKMYDLEYQATTARAKIREKFRQQEKGE